MQIYSIDMYINTKTHIQIKSLLNENEGLCIQRFKRVCTPMPKKVNSHVIGSPMNGLEFDMRSRSCRVMISEVGLYF